MSSELWPISSDLKLAIANFPGRLTLSQASVLDYLISFMKSNQCSPTYAEISRHFGFSSNNAAFDHLKTLDRKGAIVKVSNKCRSIKILPPFDRCLSYSHEDSSSEECYFDLKSGINLILSKEPSSPSLSSESEQVKALIDIANHLGLDKAANKLATQ